MFRIFTISTLVFTICILSCHTADRASQSLSLKALLIYNAQIVDVKDGHIEENKAILIDNGIIKAIGNFADLTKQLPLSQQVDVGKRYVIPGLWDMHVHIEGEDLVEDNKALFPVYIAFGITTVRDMASDLGVQVLAWREQIKKQAFLAPEIFTAGIKLEGLNSIWKGDFEISNTAELNAALDKLDAYHVDLIKITENTLNGDLFLKSIKEAKRRGYKVSGHVPIDATIKDLIDAGFSSIEHASYMLRLGSNEQKIVNFLANGTMTKIAANQSYSTNFNQDTAIANYRLLAKTGIAVTPTLIGGKQLAYLDENPHTNDAFLQYLTKRFTSKYKWRIDRMAGETPEQKQRRKEQYQLIAKQIPYIQQAGIPILAGSDAAALNTFVYPALSLHEELVLFQEAGLTPLQILQTATINGAKFMGKLTEKATIEPTKDADLVILNSNPLKDIKATQDIYGVINNGQYFDRKALNELLEEAKRIKLRLDSERKE